MNSKIIHYPMVIKLGCQMDFEYQSRQSAHFLLLIKSWRYLKFLLSTIAISAGLDCAIGRGE